jgi:zeaxanthin glucosyltransferase
MKLGFFVPSANGHINPALALAKELIQRGHEVSFFSTLDVQEAVNHINCQFIPLESVRLPSAATQKEHLKMAGKSGLKAIGIIMELLVGLSEKYLLEVEQLLSNHQDLDCLLIDSTTSELYLAAEKHRLPYITLAFSVPIIWTNDLPPTVLNWDYLNGPIGYLRNWLGWRMLGLVLRSMQRMERHYATLWNLLPSRFPYDPRQAIAYLTTSPPGFDFPRKDEIRYTYCGPFIDPKARATISFDWSKVPSDRPLIYASLGTEFNDQTQIYYTILEATKNLEATTILSTGTSISEEELIVLTSQYPNALVVRRVPQLEILETARVFITHAGMNSTLEALTYGVPMVAIPITADQPGIAARIRRAGVGEAIAPKKLTAQKLQSLVKTVMNEPCYRQNLERFQIWIASHPGTNMAADEIEKLFRRHHKTDIAPDLSEH